MSHDQVYNNERAERLVGLLRALAARIDNLEQDDRLLAAGPELLRLMGDARSELFHYEVRCTYDTPEVAESRRVVDDALRQQLELPTDLEWEIPDTEDDRPWRE